MQVLEFDPETNKLVIWKNAWAYILITIPLTCITILCWYHWHKVVQYIRNHVLKRRVSFKKTATSGSTV